MIVFKNVKWKNFLSTGNHWTEIKLNESHGTIIIGSNGAGKSTVLDALTFSLFGKPYRKINKPQLVNSVNEKDCVVEIEFDIKGKEYRIVRGINQISLRFGLMARCRINPLPQLTSKRNLSNKFLS